LSSDTKYDMSDSSLRSFLQSLTQELELAVKEKIVDDNVASYSNEDLEEVVQVLGLALGDKRALRRFHQEAKGAGVQASSAPPIPAIPTEHPPPLNMNSKVPSKPPPLVNSSPPASRDIAARINALPNGGGISARIAALRKESGIPGSGTPPGRPGSRKPLPPSKGKPLPPTIPKPASESGSTPNLASNLQPPARPITAPSSASSGLPASPQLPSRGVREKTPPASPQLLPARSLGPLAAATGQSAIQDTATASNISAPSHFASKPTIPADNSFNDHSHGVVITVPTTSEAFDATAKNTKDQTYTVYHINVEAPNLAKQVFKKRFNEFREFDKGWQKVYPGLHNTYRLPTAKIQKTIFVKKHVLVEERRQKLEPYLRGIASVKSLQPLLSQFLQLPADIFPAQQTAEKESVLAKSNIREMMKSTDKVVHGNSTEAAERARKEKEAFLRQNAALIEQLMPGGHLTLPKADACFTQSIAHKVKKRFTSIAERKGVGSKRADKPLDAFVDVGGGGGGGGGGPSLPSHTLPQLPQGCARVIQHYSPAEDEEHVLTLAVGQVVKVTDATGPDWWYGELQPSGLEGYFPFQCVTFDPFPPPPSSSSSSSSHSPLPPAQETAPRKSSSAPSSSRCSVVLGYVPGTEEASVLKLEPGQQLIILDKHSSPDWWFGREVESGQEGFFPVHCVQPDPDNQGVVYSSTFDLEEMKKRMSRGIEQFTKFAYGRGFPSTVDIFYRPLADSSSNLGCVFYAEPESRDTQAKRMIALSSISEILLGKQTAAFQRKVAESADLSRCFSIVSTERTLDLQAPDQETRSSFVRALVEICKNGGEDATTVVVKPEKDLSHEGEPPLSEEPKSGFMKSFGKLSRKMGDYSDMVYSKAKDMYGTSPNV